MPWPTSPYCSLAMSSIKKVPKCKPASFCNQFLPPPSTLHPRSNPYHTFLFPFQLCEGGSGPLISPLSSTFAGATRSQQVCNLRTSRKYLTVFCEFWIQNSCSEFTFLCVCMYGNNRCMVYKIWGQENLRVFGYHWGLLKDLFLGPLGDHSMKAFGLLCDHGKYWRSLREDNFFWTPKTSV